jgi:phosphatidylserine/phosphatidylglycerophosphate/cardiolipin synthase-like enzyme
MITAESYANGSDCFLAWKMPFIPNCLGVAIYRSLTSSAGVKKTDFIANRIGFEGDNNPPGSHQPSTVWPFQRYTWADHVNDEGATVAYSIYPVMQNGAVLTVDKANGIDLTAIKITAAGDGKTSAYFNRGILMSQFFARKLPPNWTDADLKKLKDSLDNSTDELRSFLMGPLGDKLISLLDLAIKNKYEIYCALYELDDQALISRLVALGMDAHVVLSNGSSKAVNSDGNKAAAAVLSGKVDLTRRMLWSEGLGHNKFLVLKEKGGDPLMVWTGSTNWATTGLCTQMNNGILLEDKVLAQTYLDQWNLLKNDQRVGKGGQPKHFGQALMASNDVPKSKTTPEAGDWTVWFTRTDQGQDLDAAIDLINSAKESILFLMFEPGTSGLLQAVQARLSPASKFYDPDLYVHGVVNTLSAAKPDAEMNVQLVSRGQNKSYDLRIVQPDGIKGLAGWADEVMRSDFIMQKDPQTGKFGVIGHAIIHSKILVIDPFTNPVLITGSHNFSHSASASNDENMIILKGNKPLCERYIVDIMSVYQHYRWNAYVNETQAAGQKTWDGLKKSDQWQQKAGTKNEELDFWVH